MRALVIAHAHPDFSVGGAEIAAYNLFRELKEKRQISDCVFLARTDNPSIGHGTITLRRTGEYLWRQDIGDWFRLRTQNIASVCETFRQFLGAVRPDVVYVHHYVHMGVEVLREIRRSLPNCKIVLTLHEYVAICNRNGQMIKMKSNRLCRKESPEDCNICFPERTPEDFWLRKHYIQRHFEVVDTFVSPSEFLKRRYVEWGLPPENTFVIENGQPDTEDDLSPTPTIHRRFGFFGQITEYKGVDTLLRAIHLIPKALRSQLLVEVHGANLENQGQWLQDLVESLSKPLIAEGCLRWVGPYEQAELKARMRKVGWVLVPSIWWENSPMVIQEAFVNRRPVICSGLGGMAEKVRDGIDGFHFEAKNSFDLAEKMAEAARDPSIWQQMATNLPVPITYRECADAYLALAGFRLAASPPKAPPRPAGHTRTARKVSS